MRFLGLITIPAGVAKNNTDTAVPFVIASPTDDLYLQPDTTGLQFEFGAAAAFATTAARGAFLGALNVLVGPYSTGNTPGTIVSVFNPTGGAVNVKVFGSQES